MKFLGAFFSLYDQRESHVGRSLNMPACGCISVGLGHLKLA